jgi:transposase-like protein
VQYLNNIIEQDHRAIQKRVIAKQGFRAFAARAAHGGRLRGDAQVEEGAATLDRW